MPCSVNHLVYLTALKPPKDPGRLVFFVDTVVCAQISPPGPRCPFLQLLGEWLADNSQSNSSLALHPLGRRELPLPQSHVSSLGAACFQCLVLASCFQAGQLCSHASSRQLMILGLAEVSVATAQQFNSACGCLLYPPARAEP